MKNLIYIVLAMVFASCLKPDPENMVTEPPVFAVHGSLNNSPFSMSAGIDDTYLFTDFVDYGYGKVIYNASFGDFNNQEGEALTFHYIVSGDQTNTASDLEDHLNTGNVAIMSDAIPSGAFIFEVVSSESPWVWSNGVTSTTESVYNVNNPGGLLSPVSCTVTSPECPTSVVFESLININCSFLNFIGAINLEHADMNSLKLTPPLNISNTGMNFWNVNGIDFFTNGNEPLFIPDLGENILTVILMSADNSGNPSSVWIQNFIGVSLNCPFPQIEAGMIHIAEPLMIVEYRDPSGTLYSSLSSCIEPTVQPADAHFTIHGYEAYEENEVGNPTYEIDFSAKIQLFDITNPQGVPPIWLEINNGNLALSYPQ